LLTAKLAECNQ